MKIRYYCPECEKLSILTAIRTAQNRVCPSCGITIYPEHVEQQSHHQRKIFGFFNLVPLVLLGYMLPFMLYSVSFKNELWFNGLILAAFNCLAALFFLFFFLAWCYDVSNERMQLLDKQREENKQHEENKQSINDYD